MEEVTQEETVAKETAQAEERDYTARVASNIRRLREERRFTMKELSEAIGAAPSYIWIIETKPCMPSLLYGMRIARRLGVRPEDLLARNEEG